MQKYHKSFDSKFGKILLLWNLKNGIAKLSRIYLKTKDSITTKSLEKSCPIIDDTITSMLSYFSGKYVSFNLDIIDLALCSDFQKKVLLYLYNIPRGRFSSYKRIAANIRVSKAIRAVGGALAKNPFPIIIPCHRAIRSDGSVGGYQGGTQMKMELLKLEGTL